MYESGFSNYIRNVMKCVSGAALGAVRLLSPGTRKQRRIRKYLILLPFIPILMYTVLTLVYGAKFCPAQILQQEVTIM